MTWVLLVDDDRSLCELLCARLNQHGVPTRSFGSAEEALALTEDHEFDAVVTDLSMAGMDGIDLCRLLSATRPDVPVIVMTAHGTLETAIAAIRAGAYDFITKPVHP